MAMLVITRGYHQWLPKEESHRKKLRSLRQMRVISLHPWNFIKAASILVGIYYRQLKLHFWQLTTAIVVDEHACLLVKPHTTGISNLQSYIVIVVIYTIIYIYTIYKLLQLLLNLVSYTIVTIVNSIITIVNMVLYTIHMIH